MYTNVKSYIKGDVKSKYVEVYKDEVNSHEMIHYRSLITNHITSYWIIILNVKYFFNPSVIIAFKEFDLYIHSSTETRQWNIPIYIKLYNT